MQARASAVSSSKTMLWIGYVLSGLGVLFMIFDAVIKIIKIGPVIDTFALLGIPDSLAPGIGILALICLAMYVIPRTAVLGAILVTGYLGGAISLQVRIGAPLFNLIFPAIIGALLWGGLYLRNAQLRALIPVAR